MIQETIDYRKVKYDYGTVLNYIIEEIIEGWEYALHYQRKDYAKEYWFLYNYYEKRKRLDSIISNNYLFKDAKNILTKYSTLSEDYLCDFYANVIRSVFEGRESLCLYMSAVDFPCYDYLFSTEGEDVLKQCGRLSVPIIRTQLEPDYMNKYLNDEDYWHRFPKYRIKWKLIEVDKNDCSYYYYRNPNPLR